ncbi:hypothetical protein [uncultured Williamsia sp.]|uniref:hypothetical protein n=1 Tax=uncultured Williamsia sp. TaxID=259311 RepID=UPI002608D715|nr:hypothetical protein [uncultured Williamsia sp.]
MPELDIESIAQAVREEAERKIGVLHQIVDRHQVVTERREEFLAADAADASALADLIGEAQRAGVDAKTLRQFEVEPLTGTARKRGPGRPRRPRAASAPTPAATPASVEDPNTSGSSEALAPTG